MGSSPCRRGQGPAPEALVHVLMMIRAEGSTARLLEGDADGAAGRRQAPLRATDKVTVGVGPVELKRLDQASVLSLPALQLIREVTRHPSHRMQHEPAPDQSRRVGQAVGKLSCGREQEEPSGADGIGGQEHHVGRLKMFVAVLIDPLQHSDCSLQIAWQVFFVIYIDFVTGVAFDKEVFFVLRSAENDGLSSFNERILRSE